MVSCQAILASRKSEKIANTDRGAMGVAFQLAQKTLVY